MKLYELVNKYHVGTDLTCAEAMLKACDEYYHLHLSKDSKKMFSVMGLGMQTELSCCGAFSVAVGIIGLVTAKDDESDIDNMHGYELICELTEFMDTNFNTIQCLNLQKLSIDSYEDPCHFLVEEIAKKLEQLLEDHARTSFAA